MGELLEMTEDLGANRMVRARVSLVFPHKHLALRTPLGWHESSALGSFAVEPGTKLEVGLLGRTVEVPECILPIAKCCASHRRWLRAREWGELLPAQERLHDLMVGGSEVGVGGVRVLQPPRARLLIYLEQKGVREPSVGVTPLGVLGAPVSRDSTGNVPWRAGELRGN